MLNFQRIMTLLNFSIMAGRVHNNHNAQFMKIFELFSFCIIRASFVTTVNDQTLERMLSHIHHFYTFSHSPILYCVRKQILLKCLMIDLFDLEMRTVRENPRYGTGRYGTGNQNGTVWYRKSTR